MPESASKHEVSPHSSSPELLRALGLKEAVAINVGCMIGSGIFIVPATIAGHVHAMGPILLVWILAGLLTLFGALSLAELSSVLPQSGGPYVYLRESFGKVWGFLFSWNDFFINKAGSMAAVAIAFSTYLGYFVPAVSPENPFYRADWALFGVPFTLGWNQIIAIVAIIVVTIVNIRGVQFSGWVMNIFTAAKLSALVFLVFTAFSSEKASAANLLPWWPESWNFDMTKAFGLAMVSALWAYDGWIDVTITAGETKDPTRNVPRALIISTLLVMGVYLLANVAYALIIPVQEMPGHARIAADVATLAIGAAGASIVVAGIMCSTFGTVNGQALAGPRSIYAPSHDRIFAPAFAKVHPHYRSPYIAILTIGLWGAVLTLSGTYDHLTAYVVFGSWFFYGLAALSVIVLRKKMPNVARPYKAWGYPYATLVFALAVILFIMNTLIGDTRNALIGIGILLLGLPLYWYWTRPQSSKK